MSTPKIPDSTPHTSGSFPEIKPKPEKSISGSHIKDTIRQTPGKQLSNTVVTTSLKNRSSTLQRPHCYLKPDNLEQPLTTMELLEPTLALAKRCQSLYDDPTAHRIRVNTDAIEAFKQGSSGASEEKCKHAITCIKRELEKVPFPSVPEDCMQRDGLSSRFYKRFSQAFSQFIQYIKNKKSKIFSHLSKTKQTESTNTLANDDKISQYKTACTDCGNRLQKLITQKDSMLHHSSPDKISDNKRAIADEASRLQWLKAEIMKSIPLTEQMTSDLPCKIKKTKNENKNQDKLSDMNHSGPEVAFYLGICGFQTILATLLLQLDAFPTNVGRADVINALTLAPNLKEKKRFMLGERDKSGEPILNSDLLRVVATRMEGFEKFLDEQDAVKFKQLTRGNDSLVGGFEFLEHATTLSKIPSDFIYTPEVIQQMKVHLLEVSGLIEDVNNKYSTALEFR
ncbi:MAG: hypothetical protein QS748_07585 [Candidatus Endonucleobacter bathymodioli]|uniref:Uncharacterized protein n=1 Tax=Candidatus Endonucleibacter bathymodioli TaxID=539814 RepID=A0AA90SMP2_9GAMM|nr:hypothetical protein [Candidatus Endonucleobacter bathymodioli]